MGFLIVIRGIQCCGYCFFYLYTLMVQYEIFTNINYYLPSNSWNVTTLMYINCCHLTHYNVSSCNVCHCVSTITALHLSLYFRLQEDSHSHTNWLVSRRLPYYEPLLQSISRGVIWKVIASPGGNTRKL